MIKGSHLDLDLKERMRIGRAKYWAERKALPPKNEIIIIKQPTPSSLAKGVSHRDFTVAKIANKRAKLIEAQIDLAVGYSYIDEKGDKVYTKAPDATTGQYLLNQLIGKPKESIEVKEEIRLSVDF